MTTWTLILLLVAHPHKLTPITVPGFSSFETCKAAALDLKDNLSRDYETRWRCVKVK